MEFKEKCGNTIEALNGESISIGCTVKDVQERRIYTGKILKPWTWFRFQKVNVVSPIIDHVAVIKINKK